MHNFLPVYCLASFLCLVTFLYYKKRIGLLFIAVISIYAVSAISSSFYIHTEFFEVRSKLQGDLTFMPFVYWILAFFIICRPIIQFDIDNIQRICIPYKLINTIGYIGFFLSLLPLFEMIPRVGEIFQASDLSVMLSDAHDDDNKDIGLSYIGNLCFQLLNYGYPLFLLCTLPVIRNYKNDKLGTFRFLLVVLVINFVSLINSSRSGLIYTVINILILYLMFFSQFSSEEKKKMIKYLTIFASSTIFLFSLITVMRNRVYVAAEETSTLTTFILQYAGEGFVNFNQYMDQIIHHTDGDYCFYAFKKMLGFDVPEVYRGYVYSIQNYVGIPLMVFHTFIGFFVIDIGYWGTLIFFIIISEILCRVLKSTNGVMSFSHAYLLFFYTSIIACGTCIYKYTYTGSLHIVFMLFVYFLLAFFEKKQK